MLSLLFVAYLAIASLQGTFGAPSCGSENMNACVSKCKAKHNTWRPHPYDPKSSSVVPIVPTSTSTSTDKPPAARLGGNPTSSPSTSSSSQPASSTPVSDGSVSSADIAAYLLGHNSIRSKHGAADLTWSNSLSNTALGWAKGCNFVHSGGPTGENLAAGTGGFTIEQAVKAWTDESSSYDPNNPVPSHFTQVVWKATTQVGCARVVCGAGTVFKDTSLGVADYYVCEYSPPGNVIGEFAQNVQAN